MKVIVDIRWKNLPNTRNAGKTIDIVEIEMEHFNVISALYAGYDRFMELNPIYKNCVNIYAAEAVVMEK